MFAVYALRVEHMRRDDFDVNVDVDDDGRRKTIGLQMFSGGFFVATRGRFHRNMCLGVLSVFFLGFERN